MERAERCDERYRPQVHIRIVVAEQPPPERVGQVDQPGPVGEGVEIQCREGQFQPQVRHGPPAGTIAQPRTDPADAAQVGGQRWRCRHPLGEQERRQSPEGRTESPGAAGGHDQHHCQREEHPAERRRRGGSWLEQRHDNKNFEHGGQGRHEAEQELIAGPRGERHAQDRAQYAHLVIVLVGPALFYASRCTSSTPPATSATAA
jgi:hypothetical protein